MITDALGEILQENDRVYTFDLDGSIVYGILKENPYKQVSEWYVEYEGGEECAVLDFEQIFKVNQ